MWSGCVKLASIPLRTKVVFNQRRSCGSKEFTCTTQSGFSVTIIPYGAIIKNIMVPDRNCNIKDVALGFDTDEEYEQKEHPYFGAAIGRCANRIYGAKFTLDCIEYKLSKNHGLHHLHGGVSGFDKKHWNTRSEGANKVVCSYLSPDGEEGYPGDLLTNIIYEVKNDDSLHIEFIATTTKTTVVNLTNHSYFNLGGHETGESEIKNHVVTVNASRITETNNYGMTGKLLDVGGTVYDLRTGRKLGDVIDSEKGIYDNNFCVTNYSPQDVVFVSRVDHPPSGRYMEVFSNQPGVQIYSSKYMPGPLESPIKGKQCAEYRQHGAFCIETQIYPDAVNHPNFPTPVLRPGQVYKHKVIYKFGFVC